MVRAGLVRQYATRHGLWQLDPHIAYLSGDRLPAGVRGFEVLEELAYSENRLRRALAANDCGACEILVRGMDVDPDGLRRRLRLRGTRALSVVQYMIATQGIPANRLAATGFGEFQPVDTGTSPEALARNRRIELKFTER